jgi:hypothetical protein
MNGGAVVSEPANAKSYNQKLTEAAERYWNFWPEQRAAILEKHRLNGRELLERYGAANVDALRVWMAEEQARAIAEGKVLTHMVASWLAVEDGNFGGALGAALITIADSPCPIMLGAEVDDFLTASDDDLKNRPPVSVVMVKYRRDDDGSDNRFAAALWTERGQEGISPASFGKSAQERFRALVDALDADQKENRPDEPWFMAAAPTKSPKVRAAYRDFAREFHLWTISADRIGKSTDEPITTSPGLFSTTLAKQTFYPLHRIEQAYSDVAGFEPTLDGRALVHRIETKERKRDPIEVILAPLEDPRWFPPATVDDLQNKLLAIGTSASFTFAVAVSLAIEHEFVDLELDDFIKFLGLDPRSSEQRNEQRTLLWESLKLFAQTSAVGELRGTYRDANGNQIKRIEESPIIAITGKQYPAEMRLDRSETPIAVSFVPGNFLRRNRANRKLLASLGDLRQLAAIPSGKAAGRWARTIGLALLQYWREGAAGAEIKRVGEDSHATFRPDQITRRRLFERMRPDPDPFEILKSNDPARARKYWDDAIELLHQQKSVQLVSKAKPKLSRKGWQDAWLDEPLDLRPHRENVVAIAGVASVSEGAKAWRKKRGRPRKKTLP